MNGAQRFAVCCAIAATAFITLCVVGGLAPFNGLHLLILTASALTIAASLTRKPRT